MCSPTAPAIIEIVLCVGLTVACAGTEETTSPTPAVEASAKAAPEEHREEPAEAIEPKPVLFDFEDAPLDEVPPRFTAALNGGGGPIDWRVVARKDAASGGKVLAQLSADRTDVRYPHVVSDEIVARDVEVSVSFKTISGKVDASGGVMFRYLDADNFYVVRANALEGNVVAYKTEGGKRSSIGVKGKRDAYGLDVDVPHGAWNRLRVVAKGSLFTIFLNERMVFEVEDETFKGAGKVGLWTKADAVTEFDDLRVQILDH